MHCVQPSGAFSPLAARHAARKPGCWLALLLSLLWGLTAHGGSGLAEKYLVDTWTAEDGLPDSSVTAIAQTPDGYLWLGTYNGLARFDGTRFVTFDPGNTPALRHAHIRRLYLDSRGALWINTYDGSLTTLRRDVFTLEYLNQRPSEAELALVASSSNQVLFLTSRGDFLDKPLDTLPQKGWRELVSPDRGVGALCCQDGAGTMWYRDLQLRLLRVADNRFQPLPNDAGLKGQNVNCLATNAQGCLWIGTDTGIAAWDGHRFENETPTNGETSVRVTFLWFTAKDRIWVVADETLREAVGRRWVATPPELQRALSGNLARIGAAPDPQGGIWFYNCGLALVHVDADAQVQELTAADGFPQEPVNCLFRDREGDWWAGFDSGGLARIRQRRFFTIDGGQGAAGKVVKSVCQDAAGTVWIGTLTTGLDRWCHGAVTNLAVTNLTELNSVLCVCPDADGRLWLSAGDDEDLFVRQGGRFKLIQPLVQGVKAIFADRGGRIWVGTRSGLYCSDKGASEQFHSVTNVARHYVRALAEDRAGVLWAGAGNGDLYRIAHGVVTTFRPADTSRSQAIWSLLVDKQGTVWVGTFRGGLLRFGNGHFTRYDKAAGLPDNVIGQILEDDQGNLWLGSHHGIFRVAKSALDAYARGEIKSLPCQPYGRYDGLPSLECSGDYQPAAWRGRDGRMWFATYKGVVTVQPDRIRPNLIPPTVVIDEVLVDGRRIENQSAGSGNKVSLSSVVPHPPAELQIGPGRRRLEIRFAGLSLASPDEVRCRYRLEGFDQAWVGAGKRRFAEYNYLPPGRYRFHVMACNSDGIWNTTGAVLALRIRPHFYESWWFRILAALSVIGLAAGTARGVTVRRLHRKLEQLERQQAVERERTRIAKDLHDDLGSNLTLIAVLGDLARQERPAERIEKMSATARTAVKSLDEIVWAVNPSNDTLGHLIDYMAQFATDYLRAAGIRCRLDVPEHVPTREVPSRIRHNLFLVVKEAIQNIVKHAGATEVRLRINATDRDLRLEIEDNGCGFEDAPDDAWAEGLQNMRQRLGEIGGECAVRSQPGAGTAISVTVPWPSA